VLSRALSNTDNQKQHIEIIEELGFGLYSKERPGRAGPGRIIPQFDRQPPGRHHKMVQTGTGLLRSQRRSAKSLASMMS